jgi:hypothetical protein
MIVDTIFRNRFGIKPGTGNMGERACLDFCR